MILKIFADECAVCHQSTPNPVHEIKVAFPNPQIEFDKDGHRYAIYMIDDSTESIKQYQKLIASGDLKPKR